MSIQVPQTRPRLLLHNNPYRSHAIGAAALMRACAPWVESVHTLAEAQVAILYGSAYYVSGWLQEMPALRKIYRIGHFVWEADRLTPEQQAGVSMVHEVWTPSTYCQQIFGQYHSHVVRVPHTVESAPSTDSEARHCAAKLWNDSGPGHLRLLSIGIDDVRKNYPTLIAAFQQLHSTFPQARLLLKHRPRDRHEGEVDLPGVTRLYTDLTDAQIAALYTAADVYVSAHHSEGWGLTLSQAMAHGVLTVAPAHGGNLDFMTSHNSILVPAAIAPIGPNPLHGWFTPDMQWGHPTVEALAAGLHQACVLVTSGQAAAWIERARLTVAKFAPACIEAQLASIWARIAAQNAS